MEVLKISRRIRFFGLIIVLAVFGLFGCSKTDVRALAKKATTEDENRIVQEVISAIQTEDFSKLNPILGPSIAGENLKKGLPTIRPYFQHGAVQSAEPIGHFQNSNAQITVGQNPTRMTRTALTYEVKFADGYFNFLAVTIDEKDGSKSIAGINVQDGPSTVENSKFSFLGKSPMHYLFLILTIGIPLLVLYAAILCFKMKPRRRWLWIIFIVWTFGTISMNWTTGHISITPLRSLIFGGGFTAPELQPPVFFIGLPVGAIVFLLRRKKLRPSEVQPA